jgi:HlyD family secretion protein
MTASTKKSMYTLGGILGGVIILGIIAKSAGWIGGEPLGTQVETAKSELKTVTQLVSASGTVRPEVEVIISPDVSGEIIELTVVEGDIVKQGDLLVRIRPDLYQARIDELRASLMNTRAREQQARASMLRAEMAYNRQKQLFESNNIPEMDYITAKTNFDAETASHKASEFTVQSAEAQLRRAEEELRQTVIRAPMSGTISKLNVERGERVVGSQQMTGTEILRIARMEQMEVEVRVNENDIVKVALGDTARVMVDAYANQSIRGVVTEIANSAVTRGAGTTEQISEYPVKIRVITLHNLTEQPVRFQQTSTEEVDLQSRTPFLKPGMSASVDVETQTVLNAIVVPIQAVTVRDFAKIRSSERDSAKADSVAVVPSTEKAKEDIRRVVFVVADGAVSMVEVETGINDDRFIQILRGIDNDTEIVTGSYRVLSRDLKDKDKVRTSTSSVTPTTP